MHINHRQSNKEDHAQYTVNLRGNPKWEKTTECFPYIISRLHSVTNTNSPIYSHQPEGSSNSLYLPAPTGRRLQPPFPCPVLPPCNLLMNTYTVTLLHYSVSATRFHNHNTPDLDHATVMLYLLILSLPNQSHNPLRVIHCFVASRSRKSNHCNTSRRKLKSKC